MNKSVCALLLTATALVGCDAPPSAPSPVGKFCQMADEMFHLAEPCSNSGMTIRIREMDMEPELSSKFCSDLARNSRKALPALSGYTLEVLTPESGQYPIARCKF